MSNAKIRHRRWRRQHGNARQRVWLAEWLKSLPPPGHGACVMCREVYPYQYLTTAFACSFTCLVCAEQVTATMNDPAWWAANGPKE